MTGRSGIGFWLLLGLFLCVGATVAGSAGAAIHFADPLPVSSGSGVGAPEAVVDEAGTTSIAWASNSGLESTLKFRSVAADGEPGPVRTLAAGTGLGARGIGADAGQIAVSPAGAATVVGVRFPQPVNGGSEIVAVRIGADGTPEAPLTLFDKTERYAEEPQVAVDPRGVATVVWRSYHFSEVKIEAVRIAADGEVGPVLTLATEGTEPRVAVGPEGIATVIWTGALGIEFDRIAANGTGGTASNLPGSHQESGEPALAVDSEGRATVAWLQGEGGLYATQIAADGTPGETELLSVEPLGLFADPVVAVDGDGAWVAWSKQEGAVEEFLWSIQVAWVDWSNPSPRPFTVSGPEADHPQIVPSSAGHAWLTWSAREGSSRSVIQFRRLTAGDASLGQTMTLPTTATRNYSPTLVGGSQGGVDLIWREVGTSTQRILYDEGESVVPDTSIETAPWQPTTSFSFGSTDFLIAGFECDLDGEGFLPCSSPMDYGEVGPGSHTFAVRARDEDGAVDATPAAVSGEVPKSSSSEPPDLGPVPPTTSPPPPALMLPPAAPSHGAVTSIATANGAAQVKGGRILLKIRCPGAGRCEGTATLVGVGPAHGTQLGRARFDLKPGAATTLSLPLSAAARRLFAKGRLTAARLEGDGIDGRRIKLS